MKISDTNLSCLQSLNSLPNTKFWTRLKSKAFTDKKNKGILYSGG